VGAVRDERGAGSCHSGTRGLARTSTKRSESVPERGMALLSAFLPRERVRHLRMTVGPPGAGLVRRLLRHPGLSQDVVREANTRVAPDQGRPGDEAEGTRPGKEVRPEQDNNDKIALCHRTGTESGASRASQRPRPSLRHGGRVGSLRSLSSEHARGKSDYPTGTATTPTHGNPTRLRARQARGGRGFSGVSLGEAGH